MKDIKEAAYVSGLFKTVMATFRDGHSELVSKDDVEDFIRYCIGSGLDFLRASGFGTTGVYRLDCVETVRVCDSGYADGTCGVEVTTFDGECHTLMDGEPLPVCREYVETLYRRASGFEFRDVGIVGDISFPRLDRKQEVEK